METLSAVLFLTGVTVLLFTLYHYWYKKEYPHKKITRSRKPFVTTRTSARHSYQQQINSQDLTPTESEKKGTEFEKFIVGLFDRKYFTPVEWRSDKHHNGVYAESSMNPDFEFRYSTKYKTVNFCVECKWRKGFHNNQIQWARDYQLRNYQKFAREKNITVFILIGVGGLPSMPKELYIVPLQTIATIYLTRSELADFKRYRVDKPFFLSADCMRLD